MKFVPGYGSSSAKLFVLGEAPGYHEEEAGMPFVGPTGQITRSMLKSAGVSPEECFFDNVVPYRPPANKINRLKELDITVEQFYPKLLETINAIKPNCILALGNIALKALTGKSGITNYRGSVLWSQIAGRKIVSSIHPANLFRSSDEGDEGGAFKYSARAYMQLDFNKAVRESTFTEYKPLVRNIRPIKSSYELYQFLQQFKDHKRFALDIETIKSIPTLLAIAPSPNLAISIQLINIPELNYVIPYHDLAITHELLINFLQSDKEWVGQNWKFDADKILTVLGIHMKDPYADTMLLSSVVDPEFPKSLQFLCSVRSKEPFYKSEGKEFILGKNPIEQWFLYNGKDACVTYEVFNSLMEDCIEYKLDKFFFNYTMKLHKFYMDLEAEGLLVDDNVWKEILIKYKERWKIQQARIEEIAGYDVNVMSSKQVYQFLHHDLNLPIKPTSLNDKGEGSGGTGEETLVALLGNHAKSEKQKEAISLILEIRRIRKTIGTYLSAFPDADGRMRTSYRIAGAETGRSSTSKCSIPVRPIKGFGLAFQTLTKHGDIGADIRKMFIADPGYVIMECDASQAEARVVALLSGDDETLRLFDTTDIHTLTASWLFGLSQDKISKDSPQRFMGKTVRHAGNYGMGKRRLMLDSNASARRFGINLTISEKEAGNILKIFHGKAPKIRNVFHVGIEGLLKSNDKVLINPFGRRRRFFEQWGDKLFKEAYAFIPQSTVRDHCMQACLRLKEWRPKTRFVVEAHDSITALIEKDELESVAKRFKEEFEKPIDFSNCSMKRGSLIIPAEIKIGENYKELKDYKC